MYFYDIKIINLLGIAMKIVLHNFRCFTGEATVDISHGVTLIKGVSGSGKTTILEAVFYALYGKVKKPYSLGKKKCSVKLIINENFKIFRQSGPGKLQLEVNGKIHEGSEAQAAIDQVYGNYDFFSASTYLKQGQRSPLFSGSNIEKMALIRSMSFRDDNVEDIQEKLKKAVKEQESETTKLKFERDAKEKVIKSFAKEQETLNEFRKQNPDIIFTDYNIDELKDRANDQKSYINKLRKKLQDVLELEVSIKTLTEKLGQLIDLTEYQEEIKQIDKQIVSFRDKINELKSIHVKQQAQERFNVMRTKKQTTLDELKEKHITLIEKLGITTDESMEEPIKEIIEEENIIDSDDKTNVKNNIIITTPVKRISKQDREINDKLDRLLKNKEKNEEIKKILAKVGLEDDSLIRTKLLETTSEINDLNIYIKELESSVENIVWNERQKQILKCPKCASGLTYNSKTHNNDAHLTLVGTNFEPNIKEIVHKNATVELVNETKIKLEKTIEKNEQYKITQSSISRFKRELMNYHKGEEEQIELYQSLIKIKININNIIEEINDLDAGEITDSSLTTSLTNNLDILDETKNIEDNKSKNIEQYYNEEISKLEQRRRDVQRIIDRQQDERKSHQKLEQLKEKLSNQSSEKIQKEIDESEHSKTRAEELARMCENYSRFSDLQHEFESTDKIYKKMMHRLEALVKLEDKARQVEITILEDTVNSLNIEMEKYLNILFPTDPILVIFKMTKELKTKNEQRMTCSMEIFYKNNVYDDINQLSGGEADRISLAKTLAMNNISGADYVFLDESLNALDLSLKSSVIELLKEFCGNNKVCIVISHDGIEGEYHNIIDLDNIR